ncbi:MAG TPA: class I SAM-dependent methyltransferase [Gammaproteobacteria bacterium]|nr:class I SAM-dependent methyltransferase [Gammaproteobacteria bacterium]
MFTHNEAENFYDSFGIKQNKQFYEESAINILLEHGKFSTAKNIVEFGCGTGKLATRILKYISSDDCHYTGVDISQTMIFLCQKNIEQFSGRAKCYKNDGVPEIDVQKQSADRFLCTYVLDLLTEKDAIVLLNEAHRILMPGGYLCLASLTHGTSFSSRLVIYLWSCLFKLKPSIVGGCRPVKLTKYLHNNKWQIIHNSIIISYGVPSEIVIAKRI